MSNWQHAVIATWPTELVQCTHVENWNRTRNEKKQKMEKKERNVCPLATILFCFFLSFIFFRPYHFEKCHTNKSSEWSSCFDRLTATNTYLPIFHTSDTSLQHEKVGEKVGEKRGKFYLSLTVCKRICRLFLCRSHTPTWVCQHEFANFSLPCEGRLKETHELIFSW